MPFAADCAGHGGAEGIGRNNTVGGGETGAVNRVLVLQHPAKEYLVWYPEGEKVIYFRAFAVDLAGQRCIQIQSTGTADGPVNPEKRKYRLLKVSMTGDGMALGTVNPDVLGRDHKQTKSLRQTMVRHKDGARLFADLQRYREGSSPRQVSSGGAPLSPCRIPPMTPPFEKQIPFRDAPCREI